MSSQDIFSRILDYRGLSGGKMKSFLKPDYDLSHDPFLLPDMQAAVDRLVEAHNKQQNITIYGDYDIDGLTATTILLDSLEKFGFENVDAFIPNRFVEGYGLTIDAVERIASTGANLIITVDCGSLSEKEIVRANELGVDVIVTDHHNVAPVQPPAVAVINPKRLLQDYPDMYEGYMLKSVNDSKIAFSQPSSPETASRRASVSETRAADVSGEEVTSGSGSSDRGLYPFLDLAGCGVAFKLIQALQTRLDGLPKGQEKWLLDLVALGTVCDVVTLVDENRTNVYYGLKVLSQTRRPGLKALMAVAGVSPHEVTARSLGFGLGPRMNAAGRLETAQYSLDMLRATDGMEALAAARKLDEMNRDRRSQQDIIFEEAKLQAEKFADDPVLVVSGKGWSHGIIGIVAAKLLEKYRKPTFVLEELPVQHEHSVRASGGGVEASDSLRSETEGSAPPEDASDESKGSARSYGDFSAADAIRASDDIITKGGGHKLAAGVTLPTKNIEAFRKSVNKFYKDSGLNRDEQVKKLLPSHDTTAQIEYVTEELVELIGSLEPFGSGNPQPILKSADLLVKNVRRMGSDGQHVKLTLSDGSKSMDFLAFSAPEHFFVEPGESVSVWYQPDINEWQGRRSVEGRLLHLELSHS